MVIAAVETDGSGAASSGMASRHGRAVTVPGDELQRQLQAADPPGVQRLDESDTRAPLRREERYRSLLTAVAPAAGSRSTGRPGPPAGSTRSRPQGAEALGAAPGEEAPGRRTGEGHENDRDPGETLGGPLYWRPLSPCEPRRGQLIVASSHRHKACSA